MSCGKSLENISRQHFKDSFGLRVSGFGLKTCRIPNLRFSITKPFQVWGSCVFNSKLETRNSKLYSY
jgi:hypothetical protein